MDEMWNQFFSLRHDKPRTLQLQIRQQLIDGKIDQECLIIAKKLLK